MTLPPYVIWVPYTIFAMALFLRVTGLPLPWYYITAPLLLIPFTILAAWLILFFRTNN